MDSSLRLVPAPVPTERIEPALIPAEPTLPRKTTLEYALDYAANGHPGFPCWWIEEERCACGDRDCSSPGKHPIGILVPHGALDATRNPEIIRSWFEKFPNANWALRTGPIPDKAPDTKEIMAVDKDVRHGGHFALEVLEDQYGKLPISLRQKTGSEDGSEHLVFPYPEGANIPTARGFRDGIDIKGISGYIMVEPSNHWTGGHYTWSDPESSTLEPLPPAYVALFSQASKDEGHASDPPHECPVPLSKRTKRARQYLAGCPKAVSGDGGHKTAYTVITKVVRGYCLPLTDALECLREWNARCEPPWSYKDLKHKVLDARAKSRRPWHHLLDEKKPDQKKPAVAQDFAAAFASPLAESTPVTSPACNAETEPEGPEVAPPSLTSTEIAAIDDDLARHRAIKIYAKAHGVTVQIATKEITAIRRELSIPDPSSWRSLLKMKPSGEAYDVVSCLYNAEVVLSNHPLWVGRLRFNSFTQKVENDGAPIDGAVGTWTDVHTSQTTSWLQRHEDIMLSSITVHESVIVVASKNTYHPVRDYLNGLTWDGEPRLGSWLEDCCEVEGTAYHRTVGRKWLIAAVRRIFEPGSQADHVLILEGPQGRKKSTLLRTLFGTPWFTDEIDDLGTKDSVMQLRGIWGVELSELDSMSRNDTTKNKAFLTRRFDHFRPPYGRTEIDVPRQCVFAGSTNKDTYLTDETGNRRFWVVKCGEQLHPDLMAECRDQLWAEAVVAYRAGEEPYITSSTVLADAVAEQDARFQVDAWMAPISNVTSPWCRTEPMTLSAVMVAIGVDVVHQDKSKQMRASECLKRLGFIVVQTMVNGKRFRVWAKK